MGLLIAIDGACRRNGKPDCVASGGVFIQRFDVDDSGSKRVSCEVLSTYEHESTNQRGELLALLTALEYIEAAKEEALIVTDSEYIFNAMTKRWYAAWHDNGWLTRSYEPVKNKDIWFDIARTMLYRGVEAEFYHIKGHCIPFGRVTAENALKADPTGRTLHSLVQGRYDEVAPTKQKIFKTALELSVKNNGFEPSPHNLKEWVTANVVADAIATSAVEAADSYRKT